MRRARALALLTVTALLAVCGEAVPAGQAAPIGSTAAAVAASGFTVPPDIADPACNRGRGLRLAARGAGNAVVASATMTDGSTLIALSAIYPEKRSAVLLSVTPTCAANGSFGDDGAATITVPSSLRVPKAHAPPPPVFPSNNGIWVNAIAPASGGAAIVAGIYDGHWVVGEVTATGAMKRTFGTQGWAVLPFRGEVTAILREPSGRIVPAGDNGGGGCCNVTWAAAVSASGQLEEGFGTGGRAVLPTGEDSGVELLALEPGGDILAEVGYGNMGCWGLGLGMLTPSGAPEPMFARRLQRFWAAQRFGAFIGVADSDGDGFTLVGTGQKPCAAGPSYSAPSATGLIAHFRTDGTLASSTVRFPSEMYGSMQVLPDGADTIVIGSRYADPSVLNLTALAPDGSTDPGFGSRGRAQVHTPWHGSSASLTTMVSIREAGPSEVVLVATDLGHNEVQLIRLHL